MKFHFQYRRSVWENNLAFIEQHNLDAANGIHTFTVGMNEYGDLTTDEFVRYFNGFNMSAILSNNIEEENDIKIVKDLPEKVDWRMEVNMCILFQKENIMSRERIEFSTLLKVVMMFLIFTNIFVCMHIVRDMSLK